MGELNADQITLLSWEILHDELMDGGFVQLIYNGYGPFIFKNPFAKALRQWEMREPSKLVYDAHTLWLKHRERIEKEMSDEEFTQVMFWHRGLAVPAARNVKDSAVLRGKAAA